MASSHAGFGPTITDFSLRFIITDQRNRRMQTARSGNDWVGESASTSHPLVPRDREKGTGRVEGGALYKMSGDLSDTVTGRNNRNRESNQD